MIATAEKVGKLRNALGYIRNKKKGGQIMLSSGIDPDMPTAALSAALMAAHNPKYKVVAHSIVISHGGEDSNEITPDQEKLVLKEFLNELEKEGVDLDSTPWMITRHNNTDHLHYHMIIMGTRYDYGRFDDSYLGARATRAAARVSRKYEMQTAPKADANLDVTRLPRKKKKVQKKQEEGILTETANKKLKKHVYRKAAIAAAKSRKENEENGRKRISEEASKCKKNSPSVISQNKENRNLNDTEGMGYVKGRGR